MTGSGDEVRKEGARVLAQGGTCPHCPCENLGLTESSAALHRACCLSTAHPLLRHPPLTAGAGHLQTTLPRNPASWLPVKSCRRVEDGRTGSLPSFSVGDPEGHSHMTVALAASAAGNAGSGSSVSTAGTLVAPIGGSLFHRFPLLFFQLKGRSGLLQFLIFVINAYNLYLHNI